MSAKSTVHAASKDILARLLAGENITVVHDATSSTAVFIPDTRTLILPVWDKMSNEIYDMLVGHEVGHALFTPQTDPNKQPQGAWRIEAEEIAGVENAELCHGYLNIIEDARIERLMKNKFPGLRRDFFVAYQEFDKRDFFGIQKNLVAGKTPEDMILIDKINLFFKLGTCKEMNIKFNSTEQSFIDRTKNATTFDDVVSIVKDIWDYECNKNNPNQSKQIVIKLPTGDPQDGDEEGENSDGEKKHIDTPSTNEEYHTKAPPRKSETQNTLDETIKKEFASKAVDVYYYELPEFVEKNTLISTKKIDDLIRNNALTPNDSLRLINLREIATKELASFIRETNQTVSSMMKQFDMKKAADDHKRTTVHKSGIIDPLRVVNYKTSEDIFRHCVQTKDGKNHGLVLFIDWSGSMSNILLDTVKQLTQIVLFCKKQGIAFDVYAFSSVKCSEYNSYEYMSNEQKKLGSWKYSTTSKHSYSSFGSKTPQSSMETIHFFKDFTLLNLISSDLKQTEFKTALENMFMLAIGDRGYYGLLPEELRLSSTPLDEAILAAAKYIVPKFKNANKLQIVHSVFLTDGDTTGWVHSFSSHRPSYFYETKTHKTYKIIHSSTNTLLSILREKNQCNVIGFDISYRTPSANRPTGMFGSYTYDKNTNNQTLIPNYEKVCSNQKKTYKTEGYAVAYPETSGYTEKYIIRSSSLGNQDVNLIDALDNNSSISEIKKAFIKTANNRTKSRTMMLKFINLIVK